MTQERGVRLTSRAWDAIEAADLDELAFLHGVLCVKSTRWEIHHAVRAVLENPALRRPAVTSVSAADIPADLKRRRTSPHASAHRPGRRNR
jgi:hypothetical protein